MNPLAQSFYVQIASFPNGVFISSVDLCFRNKGSSNLPVTVQIRPTNNGFPSGSVILPFSEVSLLPGQITTTNAPNFTSNYTRFEFKTPVYLTPGEYAIMVSSNDPDYEVYTAVLGGTIIGGTRIVSEQPYSGVFFKSADSATYTAYQDTDLMFQINKCVFEVSVPKNAYFASNNVTSNAAMDTAYIQSQAFTYGPSLLKWSNKTTANSTGLIDSNYSDIDTNRTYLYNDGIGRNLLADPSGNNGKYILNGLMVTADRNVSPVIDTQRMSLNAIENLINNDSINETGTFGGNAKTRYISRRVTLADGFDANAIQVYLTAYKPISSDIKVYAKILSRDDPDTFDTKNWIILEQYSSASMYSSNEDDYREYQYQFSVADGDGISYTSNGVEFNSFSTFAIKIVLLASDTTIYPIVSDMRAIALPL